MTLTALLLTILPLIMPILLFLATVFLGAAIVSMLKLPLSILGGIMAFLYVPPMLNRLVKKEYALIGAGIIGLITMLVIYQLELFWIIVGLGLLFIVYQVLVTALKIPFTTELRRMVK